MKRFLLIAAGSNVNAVTVSGNLTRDPEVKTFGDDGQLCKFGVAVNRSVKRDGEYTEEVSFFDVTVFGGFAGLCARKLKKGDSATIQGELRQDRWETPEGNRSQVYIVSNQIDSEAFFRSKDEDNVVVADAPATAAALATAPETAPAASAQTDDIPF